MAAAETGAVALLAVLLLTSPASAQIQNQPDDGQWTMPAKNYASTRYSTLDQINTSNVKGAEARLDIFDGPDQGT